MGCWLEPSRVENSAQPGCCAPSVIRPALLAARPFGSVRTSLATNHQPRPFSSLPRAPHRTTEQAPSSHFSSHFTSSTLFLDFDDDDDRQETPRTSPTTTTTKNDNENQRRQRTPKLRLSLLQPRPLLLGPPCSAPSGRAFPLSQPIGTAVPPLGRGMEPRSTLFLVFGCSLYTHNLTLSKGGSNGREIRSQGCFPGFGAIVVCFPTVVFHRHLVVVVRAVWRCRVVSLKGSVWDVGVEVVVNGVVV